MKAYVVVEGKPDELVIRRLLPRGLQQATSIVVAGERSTPVSVARTLLVTRLKPTVLVKDADSLDEVTIRQNKQITEELLEAVSGPIPVKVIVVVPAIEILFFRVPNLLDRIYGQPVPQAIALIAHSNPKKALAQLMSCDDRKFQLGELLDALTPEDIAQLQSTPPIRELIDFLAMAVESDLVPQMA